MKTLWKDFKTAWSELLDDIVAFLEIKEILEGKKKIVGERV